MAGTAISPEHFQRLAKSANEETQKALGALALNASQDDPYSQLRGQFTGTPPLMPMSGAGAALQTGLGSIAAAVGGEQVRGADVFAESPEGAIMYANGAIFDPATGRTYFPPDFATAAQIPGSRAWLREIQDKWSEDKVEEWRKKLWDQGYQGAGMLQSDKGGWGQDLIAALESYHNNRYSNYGKAVPLAPGAEGGGIGKAVKDSIDFQSLKSQIKEWGQVPFEEDLDDDTAEFFARQFVETMQKLAKKNPGWTMEQLQSGAEQRTQKKFINAPGVERSIEEAEDDEMDNTLRDSIVSISQLSAI